MNKRDFYKELMSEYMFDKEKICANAKKGRFAGRKAFPMYIGMTAAVAAVVVVAGTAIFTTFGNRGPAVLEKDPLMMLTPEQRIQRAIDDLLNDPDSMEERDWLISFKSGVTPAIARGVITQYSGGSMDIKRLIMADDTRVSNTNEIGAVFKNNTGELKGAIIRCTGYVRAKIHGNEYVILTEPVEPKDLADDNLSPIDGNTDKPVVSIPSLPNVSDPVENNTSNTQTPGVGNTHEPPDVDDPHHGSETSEPDNTSSSPDNSGTSQGNSETTSSDTGTSRPGSNTSKPEETSQPSTPVIDKNKLPEGVKLPVTAEKFAFITDDIGAQRAYFLSENVFYVKAENAVRLYKWDGENAALAAEQEISDAKVTWVSANGLRLMVSGTENGVRRKLYILDAKNCTINNMQIDEMLGDEGAIAEAAYNEQSDLFVLNVLDDGSKYIFAANLSGYQAVNDRIVAYGSEHMSILAAKGSTIYYSELNNGSSVIYRSGEPENTAIITANGLLVSVANPAFTHAVVVGESGAAIFDPDTESLISISSSKDISFGASAHSFSDGSGYFTVSSGAIVPEERITEIAKVDFTRSFSPKYAAVISNGSVRIIPSIYTKQVKNAKITFEAPSESATAEQREAVNLAIGAENAIASGTCAECGINTSEKLVAVIESCFSDGAAKELIRICGVPQSGELSYSGGSLTQISVSDTVLTMESGSSGKLYIKIGTFEGKAAYIVKNVALINENGLKVDTII